MQKFAKLFDVGERQLIVYFEYANDDDEDKYLVHQISALGFAMIDITFSGPEVAMRKVFDMYEQATAENFFNMDIIKKAMDLDDEKAAA